MWESSWNSPCCDKAWMKDLWGTEGAWRGTSDPAGTTQSFGGSKLAACGTHVWCCTGSAPAASKEGDGCAMAPFTLLAQALRRQ